MGFEEGPIPWLAVHEYSKRYNFSDDEYEILWYFIKEMDKVYLKFIRLKREKTTDGKR